MRSAGNFSPEWGYLAPAPSFTRIARVVLVATAIGATAGAGVVLSLLDRPSEPKKSPVAARAIVTSVRAAAVPSVAPAAPAVTAAPAKPASPPASVAAAPPGDKRDTSTRSSSRTTLPANAAAPTPAASTAAALPNTPAAAHSTPALPVATVNSDTAAPASAAASASTSAATALPAAGEPSNVVEAVSTDAPDSTTIVVAEQAAPAKKAKHHASNKNAQFPGIGSIFRRMFASHGGRSYYPNSQ